MAEVIRKGFRKGGLPSLGKIFALPLTLDATVPSTLQTATKITVYRKSVKVDKATI